MPRLDSAFSAANVIANGPIGWTTGRFLLANRIVGASVGTDEHQIINHVLDFYRELMEHAVARLQAKRQTDSS